MSGHEKYIEEDDFRYDLEFEVFTDVPECVSVCAAHLQVNLGHPDVVRLRDQLNDWLAVHPIKGCGFREVRAVSS